MKMGATGRLFQIILKHTYNFKVDSVGNVTGKGPSQGRSGPARSGVCGSFTHAGEISRQSR